MASLQEVQQQLLQTHSQMQQLTLEIGRQRDSLTHEIGTLNNEIATLNQKVNHLHLKGLEKDTKIQDLTVEEEEAEREAAT